MTGAVLRDEATLAWTEYPQDPIGEMFEWDPDKATSNRLKHGISFEQASEAFKDPFAIELIDDRFAMASLSNRRARPSKTLSPLN